MILEKHSEDIADMKQKISDNCDRMDLIDSCTEDFRSSEAVQPISAVPTEVEGEHNSCMPMIREHLGLGSFPPWSFQTS